MRGCSLSADILYESAVAPLCLACRNGWYFAGMNCKIQQAQIPEVPIQEVQFKEVQLQDVPFKDVQTHEVLRIPAPTGRWLLAGGAGPGQNSAEHSAPEGRRDRVGGEQGLRPQVPFIVVDSVDIEQLEELFLERCLAMMVLLVGEIALDLREF